MAEEVAHDSERGPSRDARRTRLEVAVAAPDESSRHDLVTRLTERDDITVVGEVSDAIAVTEVAVTRRPDVALLDADLPDLADACRWIGRTAPQSTSSCCSTAMLLAAWVMPRIPTAG